MRVTMAQDARHAPEPTSAANRTPFSVFSAVDAGFGVSRARPDRHRRRVQRA